MGTKHFNAEAGDTQERWLPVVGYEGFYEVSDRGRVRSVDRLCVDKLGRKRKRIGLPKKISRMGHYRCVMLCRNGEQKMARVHRLVAGAFIRPIPDGMVVNHIDNCQMNNNLVNLEIVTVKENNQHAGAFYKGLRANGIDQMDYYHTKAIRNKASILPTC